MYAIGLRADRLHAQRTVKGPVAVKTGPTRRVGGSGSSTVRGLPHSAGYYAWQLRVRTRQYREAHHYARVLERYIRARRHPTPARTLSSSGGYHGVTSIRYAVAFCESGGDPYNTHNPKYRGKWQFDQATWDSFAPAPWRGHDPATVPESIQDSVAMSVTFDAWPNC